MKLNVNHKKVFTHEGGKAVETTPYETLKRTVLACMLFEDNFYESGVKVAERIEQLCTQVKASQIIELALIAAQKYHLRHIPLMMIKQALKADHKGLNLSDVINKIIVRPDMITDLLALYWKEGKKPLPNQLKKGIAKAFTKFDAYQLAKYNRDNPIKLRDALFMCHAKPKDEEQATIWKQLVDKSLPSPDTWEVRLSAGENKKESFQELLFKGKMGKLAILRNLRNMKEAGIPKESVAHELLRNPKEMLPFQYLAAAKECVEWEDIVDKSMIQACGLKPKLMGRTIVLVDVSGSMSAPISAKSKMTCMDAACGMAILLRECTPDLQMYTFSEKIVPVPPRQGMALRDALTKSQYPSATYLGAALNYIIQSGISFERIIVITDEQCQDSIPHMPMKHNYILNVCSNENGVGNKNQWVTITGFSEASIDFIREYEEIK